MTRPPSPPGSEIQKAIIERAHALDWKVAHFSPVQDIKGYWRTPARIDGKGFLDLVLVRERLIMAEVKGETESLKPEQKLWIEWLTRAGIENYVWRPRDWFGGAIDKILA